MIPGTELAFFLLVVAASALLVGAVRRFAITHGVLAQPTARGSHVVATPRGGGLGAIAVILTAFIGLAVTKRDVRVLLCVASCASIALVGWLDDRRGLSVGARLRVHLLGGLTVGLLSLQPGTPLAISVAGFAAWCLWTVASVNFVNFMDGINGFVATQIAIFAMSLTFFGGQPYGASRYAAAVAAACVGFLPWNYPRARIFLGDVGSGALGFLVPVLAIMTMREKGIGLSQAFLPLVPLFGDAIVTIVRRWRHGERLTEAHRSHLYQRMANGGAGHTKVTLVFALASGVGAVIAHHATPVGWRLPAIYVATLLLLGALLEWRLGPELA